jgi:hypothetical protein
MAVDNNSLIEDQSYLFTSAIFNNKFFVHLLRTASKSEMIIHRYLNAHYRSSTSHSSHRNGDFAKVMRYRINVKFIGD